MPSIPDCHDFPTARSIASDEAGQSVEELLAMLHPAAREFRLRMLWLAGWVRDLRQIEMLPTVEMMEEVAAEADRLVTLISYTTETTTMAEDRFRWSG